MLRLLPILLHSSEVRHKRRLAITSQQTVPRHVREKRVVFDILGTRRRRPQPLLRKPFQQAPDQLDCSGVLHVARKTKLVLNNLPEKFQVVLRLVPVGKRPTNEFETAHTNRPPINATIVPAPQDNLRRHVLRCAHQCVRSQCLLAGQKVQQFAPPIPVQRYIFRLDVTVHVPLLMQVLDSQDDGASVELGGPLLHDPNVAQHPK
mmetsp:Transcript_65918/g.176157  ORF Transcript_65918/g.176157 Transcript_65918/m.176157 type:complete len:205 (-) Transcript_65918:482-1096(-)